MKREEDKEPKSARDLLSGDALERMFNEGKDKRSQELAEEAQRIANRSSADPEAGSRYDFPQVGQETVIFGSVVSIAVNTEYR